MALRTLAHVAQSPKCPPSARVSACQTLLDRGWGKAPQEHTGPDGGDIRVTIRQIVENASNINDLPKAADPDEGETE